MTAAPPNERRQIPRIDVYAQANVISGGEVHLMGVRNLSSGGVYLEGTSAEYPDLRPGTEIELTLFGAEEGRGDDEDLNVRCVGRIVRIDLGFGEKRPPGFGVAMNPVDDDQRERLTSLLIRAAGPGLRRR